MRQSFNMPFAFTLNSIFHSILAGRTSGRVENCYPFIFVCCSLICIFLGPISSTTARAQTDAQKPSRASDSDTVAATTIAPSKPKNKQISSSSKFRTFQSEAASNQPKKKPQKHNSYGQISEKSISKAIKRPTLSLPRTFKPQPSLALRASQQSIAAKNDARTNLNPSTNTTSAKVLSSVMEPTKSMTFSAKFAVANLQSLIDKKDGSKNNLTQYSSSFEVAFKNHGSLSAGLVYLSNNNNSEASDYFDSEIRYAPDALNMIDNQDWTFAFSGNGGVVVPTSKDSIENQQLKSGLIADIGLSLDSKSTTISQSYTIDLEAYKYFHEYQTAFDNSANVEYLVDQTLSATFGYGKFSLFGMFMHYDTFDYKGNTDGFFRHKEGLGFAPMKGLTLQVGHANSGNIFRPNGSSSNIKLTDEDSSLYFIKLGVAI